MTVYTSVRSSKAPVAVKHALGLTGYDLTPIKRAIESPCKDFRDNKSPRSFLHLPLHVWQAIDKPKELYQVWFRENGYEYCYSFHFNPDNMKLTTNFWVSMYASYIKDCEPDNSIVKQIHESIMALSPGFVVQ